MDNSIKERIIMDVMAYTGCSKESALTFTSFRNAFKHIGFKYILYWRLSKGNGLIALYAKLRKRQIGYRFGIEIGPKVQIGGGFRMIHPWGITFNSKVLVGNNVTVLKGVTLGNQKRGKYDGSPEIGDNVYVGLNSTIVGKVKIGSNVLIAPNSFVNRSVDDNTIVIGNPMVLRGSLTATEGYLPSL